MKDQIIIANASGYWGDEGAAIARQVRGGPIDYLTLDYLAEITMIIMARQKAASEDAGYARDFVAYMRPLLREVAERGITVICNAGGINPGACGRALEAAVADAGVHLPVAIVDGDDLLPRLQDLAAAGVPFTHLDTGEPIGDRLSLVNSANAYIGARPIAAALGRGARIVVTGRTYDAASVLAPMVHEFGWDWQDYDRLAAGLLAGHLIECGAQVTGGNYTLWRDVGSFENMGYPLVEVAADGSFVLTKHPGTGGLVSRRTATEQCLYEIGDPRAYASPDVIADFTSFTMEEEGQDRVRIRGVRGRMPTGSLKVSMTYEAGMRSIGMVVVSGPEAVAKARKFAEIFWSRVRGSFEETRTELLGYNGCWGESAAPHVDPNEVVLRFACRSSDKRALEAFSREMAGIALAGPPGICGAGGRPSPQPAFGYWPALIERRHVVQRMFMEGEQLELPCESGPSGPIATGEEAAAPMCAEGPRVKVPLGVIAHARSGDKGDTCNIGVAALRPELYPELVREVTAERVAAFFASLAKGPVRRFRLDNLCALNFTLQNALGGGGTISLQLDNQGKTASQGLLTMEIEVASSLLEGARKRAATWS
ncbi:MAG TPA: acyclic terpene utilization AtuA family protein [Candidatus Limnocylindrales bacterium]|nr:acyclic terpene utilization AtuA family protein [Candidatus Limnocylindrales bacterium]